MRAPLLCLGVGLTMAACAADGLIPRGGYCHSLSDCRVGLVCVENRCSDDLDALVTGGPDYTEDAAAAVDSGLDAGLDAGAAGADGGATPSDGSAPMDATSAPDSGRLDAAVADAGTHDAAQPLDAAHLDASHASDSSTVDAAADAAESDAAGDAM